MFSSSLKISTSFDSITLCDLGCFSYFSRNKISQNCSVLTALSSVSSLLSEAQSSKAEIVAKVSIILYKLKPRVYFHSLPYMTCALVLMYSVQNLCNNVMPFTFVVRNGVFKEVNVSRLLHPYEWISAL